MAYNPFDLDFNGDLWESDDLALNSQAGRRGVDRAKLKRLFYDRKQRPFTQNPLDLPAGSDVVLDVESYWNYWLCGFKHIETGHYFYMEMRQGETLNVEQLRRVLWHFRTFGFNSKQYDMPVIEAAIKGADCYELKELTNEIIKHGKRAANPHSPYNHVDLLPVAPLKNSLKGYGACLHAERLQELPIDEDAELTEDQIEDVRDYNFNDLDLTELLLTEKKYGLLPHVGLRDRIGAEIDEDLRSKSDAQVAEAFINAKIGELTGRRPRTPEFEEGFSFNYKPPEWMKFQTPMFDRMFDQVQSAQFQLNKIGRPMMPSQLASAKIRLGICEYKLGMGGLHSSEKSIAYRSDDTGDLIDTDVESYYPWIIINNNYFPQHLGDIFLRVFRDDLVLRRIALKRLKDHLEAGLKIAINGTFGKLGNVYSTIYSPHLLIQTTVTGQLGLLMLIEMMEQGGFAVLSANTDGVVARVPKWRYDDFKGIVGTWERATAFRTEEARYRALFSADVNNYIAVKENGECKPKGKYTEEGSAQKSVLSKNPETLICSDAVKEFLSTGKNIKETIRGCTDIRRFVTVRKVQGGAHKDGYYLGKTIRWYYAKEIQGEINYVTSGNKVPDSEGAKPLMELGALPHDIDFEYYERKAHAMLAKIGYFGNVTRQKVLF